MIVHNLIQFWRKKKQVDKFYCSFCMKFKLVSKIAVNMIHPENKLLFCV